MGQLASYVLELRNMPAGVHRFSYTVGDSFFRQMESADIRSGEVAVALTVNHGGDIFDLSFEMKGEIVIGCDRCLDDLRQEVDTEYHIVLKYGENCGEDDDEVITVLETERSFDLSHLIYDTIALTIPMKHVHEEGGCNAEMMAQLQAHSCEACGEEEEEPNDTRWNALRDIIDNNK